MKNYLSFLTGLLFLFSSCVTDIIDEQETLEEEPGTASSSKFARNNGDYQSIGDFFETPEPPITVIPDEFIIKYANNVSSQKKDSLRQRFNVKSYEKCDCTVNSEEYELWIMDEDLQIEPSTIVDDLEEGGIEEVSKNFSYMMPMSSQAPDKESDEPYINSTFNDLYLKRIKTDNNGITIAVLDTGIDVDFPGFSGDFLYNAKGNAQCGEESGWDFVNGDSNPYDDYPKIHGTVVSYIIHNELTKRGIDHQILPVKVADSKGKATAFNTLCGVLYAGEKGADIINMSLGWYSSSTYTYSTFFGIISNTLSMFITSAGNSANDNDMGSHYPSGFPQDNVLAIAAATYDTQNAAGYSNFGINSVDFYARGNAVKFPLKAMGTYAHFFGTSFAAPLVSARAAEIIHFDNAIDDDQLRVSLNGPSFADPISYSKQVYYHKLIK